MPPSYNKERIGEILTRGVENIYPSREFLESRLKSQERLTVYCGYDPTAPTLHIGHGITLLKLRQFQALGHQVIMLIGDFTAMIGDPTNKLATRQQLTRQEVLANCRGYQKQASAILNFAGKNKALLKFNSAWLNKLTSADWLELAAHFTVPRLLERDMFQERLKRDETIHLHEFLYPVMQAYDSVAMNVDGEVGGNDQTFNMLAGRELLEELKGKEKFVLTTELLVDSAGKKMGKSEGNMVALSDSPEDMFGKVMAWSDEMIVKAFELCTRVPLEEIRAFEKQLQRGANPRDLKSRLAFEAVKTFLGVRAAKQGEKHFQRVFREKDRPADMPEIKPSTYDIVTVLVESKLVSSKTEARRAIVQGGVRVNGVRVEKFNYIVKQGDVVQKGKRFFAQIV